MVTKAQIDNSLELYNNLQANIQDASLHLGKLHSEIASANQELNKLADQIREHGNQFDAQRQRLLIEKTGIEEQIKTAYGRYEELEKALTGINLDISDAKKKLAREETLLVEHQQIFSNSKKDFDAHSVKLAEHKNTVSNLSNDVSLARAKHDAAVSEMAKANRGLSKINNDILDLRSRYEAQKQKIEIEKASILADRADIKKQREEIQSMRREVLSFDQASRKQYDKHVSIISNGKSDIELAAKELISIKNDIAEQKRQLASVSTSKDDSVRHLNNIHLEISDKNKELKKIDQDLFLSRNQYAEQKHRMDIERSLLDADRESLRKEKEKIEAHATDAHIQASSSKKQHERNITLIGETNQAFEIATRELSGLKPKITEVRDELRGANESLRTVRIDVDKLLMQRSQLESDLRSMKEQNRKELESFISQKRSIEQEIEIKQRSLDSFHLNKAKMEEDLKLREYDLDVLEARLRIALTENKIPFRL